MLRRAALAAIPVTLAQFAAPAAVARAESAYELAVVYTGEVWQNTRGGLRTGSSYLDNLDVQLTVDGEKAWGATGLTLFGYLLHNNGGTVSETLVGDAQGISNIEALKHTRLYELWADWAFGRTGRHSLRVGLYDLNSEFDTTDVGSLFTGSENGIGTQIAQTGLNGPSVFPITSLGARYRWQPASNWVVQIVALDGVPGDPDDPSSNSIHLGGDDGLLLVSEAIWRGNGRLRKASLGAWTYTEEFDDLLQTDASGVPLRRGGNDGIYALVEGNLWNGGADSPRSLDAYARFGTADDRINRFDSAWVIGAVCTGLFPSRPQDQLGIALSEARNGGPYGDARALAGSTVDAREFHYELTYRAQVTDWLALQPTLHYVVNPDTEPSRSDALVVGLRFELAWGTGF
jgi:porin